MEEAEQYDQCTKEELIQRVADQNRIIKDLMQTVADLKKELEVLKPPVPSRRVQTARFHRQRN